MASILATPEVLAEVGVKSLRLEATLHRAELERYRKSLRSSDYMRPGRRTDTCPNGGDGNVPLVFNIVHIRNDCCHL